MISAGQAFTRSIFGQRFVSTTQVLFIALVSGALWSPVAHADAVQCETFLKLLRDEAPGPEGVALIDEKPSDGAVAPRKVTLKELFTVQSPAQNMGFQPTHKVIEPTNEELTEILREANRDTQTLLALSFEIRYYFETIPFQSIGDALELAQLRIQMNVHPKELRALYIETAKMLDQGSSDPSFLWISRNNYLHDTILGLLSYQVGATQVSLATIEKSLEQIRAAFPGDRRILHAHVFHAYIGLARDNQAFTLNAFLDQLVEIQTLPIAHPEMGFHRSSVLHPKLEEALTLRLLGEKAKLTQPEMMRVLNGIITQIGIHDFNDVLQVFARMILSVEETRRLETAAKQLKNAVKIRQHNILPTAKELGERTREADVEVLPPESPEQN